MTTRRGITVEGGDAETEERPSAEAEFATVRPGESLQGFAARVGVAADRIRQLNDRLLEDDARVRGFSHTFIREVPNDDGTISRRPDAHVFAGQVLRLHEPQKEG